MKPMTVQEAIALLQQVKDQTAPVVLALDEEGNDFGILVKVEQDLTGRAVILWPANNTVIAE